MIKAFIFFFFLIFIKICLCTIVFPFKTAYVNKNGDIDQNSKDYNYFHFMNDYFETLLYYDLEIGSPPQKVKVIITYDDCGFKIGLAKKCIMEEEYLSYYYKNDSSDFEYSDRYKYNIYEFDDGHSAVDSMQLYTDINLKNYKKFQKMDFYLGTDTREPICGLVGLKLDSYGVHCPNISIINNFKLNNMIDNYKWTIKYNSNDEGLIIFGAHYEEVINNYNEANLYPIHLRMLSHAPWCFDVDLLTVFGDKNRTYEDRDMWAEINSDYTFLIGNSFYEDYVEKNYFKDYIDKGICYKNEWSYSKYYKYNIFECDKDKFGKEDIKKFPSLSFLKREPGVEIIFENNELFTETKYKYFYNVIFRQNRGAYWVFGKLFFKKYPTIFISDQKIIELYKESYNPESNNNESNTKVYLISIGIVIILVCITAVLFYLLGKNLNKIRKKKANELNDDEYDYISKNDINNDNKDN